MSTNRSRVTIVEACLFLWLISIGVAAGNFLVYREQMQFGYRFFPKFADDVALFFVLQLTAVLVCLPGLAIAGLASLSGRPAWSRLAVGLWGGLAALFLLTDAASLSHSGSHLIYYLSYLSDIIASPQLKGFEMVGGGAALTRPILAVSAALALILIASISIVRKLTPHPRLERGVAILCMANVLAIAISQFLWSDLVVLTVTYQRLAIPLPSLRALLTQRRSTQVRIVEVTTSTTKQDKLILHNFGPEVSLEGWRLVTRKGETRLDSALPTAAERTVELDLDPKTEWLALLDSGGRVIDSLQYTPATARVASSLPYQRARAEELGPAVERLEASLRTALGQAVPLDTSAHLTAAKKKNVLLIVVESWRRDSVNPQDTPNIAAWASGGMTMKDHVAGANATHLSTYTLLYGRSAIFYRRDLNAHVKPQLTETLRLSGYKTTYLSCATSVGWRWMERMFNLGGFDEVHLGQEKISDSSWLGWVEGDREFFGRAARILNEEKEPQFVVLHTMSTHFPYPFPKEFDVRQPSLGYQFDRRLLGEATAEVLKNRYYNTVAFFDHTFGQLLKEIDPSQTIVILTGDHGESLWDDGTIAHATLASGVQVEVPFMMVGPGIPKGSTEVVTYHGDLLPTLLHALEGKAVAVQGGHGLDLLEPIARDSVPVVPVVSWSPYELVFFGPDARLKLHLESTGWFSGRGDLGILDKELSASFVGDVDPSGRTRGSLPQSFDFAAWTARLDYWSEVLKR